MNEVSDNRTNPFWWGLGLSVVPLIVLAFGYLNVHPEFYRDVPKEFGRTMTATEGGIAWGEDEKNDPPLEFVSDSFKGVNVTTEKTQVNSFWNLFNQPNSTVEFEWNYKVKNLTDDRLKIDVEYKLMTRYGGTVQTSKAYQFAEPGETVEIKGQGALDYMQAKKVTGSTWGIWHAKE